MARTPISNPEPNDSPMSYCPEHELTYNPYQRQRCPECWNREATHAEAREWLKDQKAARVSVELDPLDENGMIPRDFEGDALVKWQGESRLLRIRETRPDDSHPAHRYFTLEGGFPVEWYEDKLTDAVIKALDSRMMAIPQLV